jgi:hypothetical protein
MRTRMYGGVAGESGRPLPLCRLFDPEQRSGASRVNRNLRAGYACCFRTKAHIRNPYGGQAMVDPSAGSSSTYFSSDIPGGQAQHALLGNSCITPVVLSFD